jgi:hypothetical protein
LSNMTFQRRDVAAGDDLGAGGPLLSESSRPAHIGAILG